jgi:AbrB family looped-hinge helix DNA binding protein
MSVHSLPVKSTISSKGQITVPVEIRVALGLRPGTEVVFEGRPGGAFLRKGRSEGREHPVDRAFGSLALAGPVDGLLEAMRGPGLKAGASTSRKKAKPGRAR